MKRATCVIAAYNEADRIGGVLEVVANHLLIGEVIVVDDGSTDATSSVVGRFSNVRLVKCSENRGKSFAVAIGIKHARNDIIILLDADLIGLTSDNVTRLIEPVVSRTADISISLRGNSLLIYRLIGLDFVSGERVFAKSLIVGKLEEIKGLPSFGLEPYMNKIVIENNLRVAIVRWMNVASPRKAVKVGMWKGVRADVSMIAQILTVLTLPELIYQNYKMRSLSSGF